MDPSVPYMPSVTNLHRILDKIQNAGVPEVFNLDFLRDLGFTSSQDRAFPKLLKYLGLLDQAGKPQSSYRAFMDQTQAKAVLAGRLKVAYDDLFLADREANTKTATALKGWFKTKTGEGDSVAEKIATTFKSLASYADFTSPLPMQIPPVATETNPVAAPVSNHASAAAAVTPQAAGTASNSALRLPEMGFVYRLEIHLPDTQNVETFRAIFRALREEMVQ
jgi:hypothetical protein